MPKHRTVIIILTCLLIAVIFGWFYQHRQSSMALESFQNKITVDYQRKFIDLTRHYSMLIDLTEAYEETGSDQEELFEIALNYVKRIKRGCPRADKALASYSGFTL